MATAKKTVEVAETEVKEEVKKPAKKVAAKKAAPKAKVEETAPVKAEVAPVKADSKKATIHDYEIILEPLITEKSMAQSQTVNQFTFKVKKSANKTEIRNAIEHIYNVHVTGISTVKQIEKSTTRGSKFKGTISGFKKAIVTIRQGETINLFAE